MPTGIQLRDSADLVPPRGHYAHTATHAGVVYVSGQLPVTPEGVAITDAPFAVQARQTLDNLDNCLVAAGTSRDRLLAVTVYVSNMADWPEFDALYAEWIGAHRPSRAVAGVSRLHYGAAVEVQAVAAAGT
ncbi:RidA family protein [Streptomyces sp. NBC_01102]|uniref:RidA family protein n=1 Tax=Streptomyces sp. NBC_01102 TaxID=2903749 RepID=UPI003862EF01|nr:RidA family protein [Streptomyces sp. NBC_01102]